MDSINSSPPEQAAQRFICAVSLECLGPYHFYPGCSIQMNPAAARPAGQRGVGTFGRICGSGGRGAAGGTGHCPQARRGAGDGHEPSFGERESGTASSLHFHLQPVPACVGDGSIYSALFLAPSSEEPDSQLMTGTHRGVSATLRNGMCTRGADVRRLKVAAFANALPSQGGGLFEGRRPPPTTF